MHSGKHGEAQAHDSSIYDSTDSIRMLQEQLGHVSIGTTMRYRKVAGKELKDWYSRLWEKRSNG